MRVRVLALRHRGRKRGSFGTLAPQGLLGSLSMHSRNGGKSTYTAATLKAEAPKDPDLLPPLYEPVLVAITNYGLLLRGYESVDGASYVQEWHCEFE